MKDAEMVAFPEEGEHIRELGVRGKVRGENVDEYYRHGFDIMYTISI